MKIPGIWGDYDNLTCYSLDGRKMMLVGFIILIFCQLCGHSLVQWLGLPIPGAVAGLILLFIGLLIRGYVPESLAKIASTLLPLLPLFLIPASTGIIQHGDLLSNEWLPITLAISLSMVLSVIFIPFVFLFFTQLFGKR